MTALLATAALVVAFGLGLPLGVFTGSHPTGPVAAIVRGAALLCLSVPPLIASILLVALAAAVASWQRLNLTRELIVAALRAGIQLAAVGALLLALFRETGLPGAFIAFGSDRILGIHYLVWVPALLLAALSFVMQATPYGRRV